MDKVSKEFIDDLTVQGMLHCAAVRSRIHRGTIREIVAPELPPNVMMIREADLPGGNCISMGNADVPLLAGSNVEHIGQAVALLCGPNEPEVHRLAELVEVQYDRGDPLTLTRDFKINQKLYSRQIAIGNTQTAFEKASQIVEGEYTYRPEGTIPVGAAGALAVVENDGIRVATPTRWLFHVRQSVAAATGLHQDRVRVMSTRVTRADTNCLWYPSLTAAQTAVAALVTGKPVRMIATAREKRLLLTKRTGCIITHKTALGRSGEVTAMEIQIVAESGAFGIFAAEYLDRLCLAASGSYAAKSLKLDAVYIATSTPPAETHGGAGFDGAFFSVEVHANRLAELCQEDPSVWRLKNLLPDRGLTVTRARAGPTPQRKLIDLVVELSDFRRKYSANEMLKKRGDRPNFIPGYLRGIGIATCFHGGSFMSDNRANSATVTVKLNSESELSILSSSAMVPEATVDILSNSAARILNIDSSQVHIEPADTAAVPDSGPAIFSRDVTVVHRLLTSCCQTIQKQRFRTPLPIEMSRNRSGGRGRRWDPEIFRGVPFSPLSWASCVVEIELDTVTFELSIRGVWIAIHPGSLLDEKRATSLVESELHAAFEACGGYNRFFEPVIRFSQRSGARPAALEGIATNVFAPAFVSAVSQATGFYFDSVPLSKTLILQYLET
ncbi:MAG: molybdopterin-dependent oxidoreductase [Spirochaetales bacterium]|nr:molybdopterin-dependent oxidoreductase [Spirochaetales bacterium]